MKYLIAGLGNIGDEYEGTRHNIGFNIADALVEEAGASFVLERHAWVAGYKVKGRSINVIKPTTYMNLSGKAIRYWLQQLKIPEENLLVVVDDIALPFGKVRMRLKGNDAGHNGLRNIIECLGSPQFARLKFGVGDDFHKGRQIEYVLGKWKPKELDELTEKIKHATDAVKSFVTIGPQRTMNQFN